LAASRIGSDSAKGEDGRRIELATRWTLRDRRLTVPAKRSSTIATVTEAKLTSGQTLAKVPIFSGLAEGKLAFLTQRAVPRRYMAGEIVFSEGEPCSGLRLAVSASSKAPVTAGNRCSVSMDRVVPSPSSTGSMTGHYPASAAAIDDATLLFVSKQDFQALCRAHPQVALKVLWVVGACLRRLAGIIEELSFTTV